MKNKIKIGIINSLNSDKYNFFLKNYFEQMGCNIIYCQSFNNLDNQINNNCDLCINYLKEYNYLKEKTDYIIINKDVNKCIKCPLSNKLYISLNLEKGFIVYINSSKIKFISMLIYNSLLITKNFFKILYCLLYAMKKNTIYKKNQSIFEVNKLRQNNKKVLIIGANYIIENKKIMKDIINELEHNNINYILSSRLNNKYINKYYQFFSIKAKNLLLRKHISSFYYAKKIVDGIIFITYSNCNEFNSLVYLLLYYNSEINSHHIILDKQSYLDKFKVFINNIK